MAGRDSAGLVEALQGASRETRLLGVVADPVAQEVLKSPSVRELDRELASHGVKDLRPMSGGPSSVVLDAGDKVVRVGVGEVTPRPNVPEMLQAERYGSVGSLRYEVLPKVDTKNITEADVQQLREQLKERGYQWTDAATDNVGRHNGRLVVTDPTGVERNEPTKLAMESAYRRVERDALERTQPQEQPRAVLLGGQPGSGKSELAAEAVREFRQSGGAIVIDADRMREENPRYKQLSKDDPQNAADKTHREAAEWSTRLRVAAIEGGRNLVVDGTLRDPDNLREMAAHLKAAGYQVEARVMAVNPETSITRARLRFEEQVQERGTGRFVNQAQHDNAYAGLPASVRAMEAEKLVDRVSVYDSNQRRIYENSVERGEWKKPPEAEKALDAERTRAWTHAEQRDYVSALGDIVAMTKQRTQQPDAAIEAKLESARGELNKLEQSAEFRRAEAFDRMPKAEALAKHPELDGAYAQLRDLRQQTAGASQDERERSYFAARAELSERLHRGEIPTGSVTKAESEKVIEMAASERGIKSVRDTHDVQRDIKGEVVAVSSHHALVKLSEDVGVRVEKAQLDRDVHQGDRVSIQYGKDQSKVHEQGKEPAREQAHDQARGLDR